MLAEVERRFSGLGGVFLTPAARIAERLGRVRGVVFDWDGVFNAGAKGEGAASTFNEADSMGTNLLRYALWLRHDGELPLAAIVTGVDNPTARRFAEREHFHAICYNAKSKAAVVEELSTTYGVTGAELACVFDDVNDLGVAALCGVRVLIRRDASPLLQDYAARHGLCDYITGQPAERSAVREACELMLGLLGEFDRVVASRVAWDEAYTRYFAERQAQTTALIDRAPR